MLADGGEVSRGERSRTAWPRDLSALVSGPVRAANRARRSGSRSGIKSSVSSATFPAFHLRPARTASPRSIILPRRETSILSSSRCDSTARFPLEFAERFRQIGAEVDPALQLRRVVPLSEFYDQVRSLWRYMAWGIGPVTISVLLLSAAGIYALMSFTVAQRTREIGIRAALGANPRRILLSIFGRVMRQLALGLLVGSLLSAALFSGAGFRFGRMTAFLLAVAALMLIVGLLAALGPARRSLRIQAIEALRADG